ncbi:MAG: hypothetical protein ACRDEA_01565 [Microcystaceae cyanobacterium]
MSRQKIKRGLEVHVSFEASRIACECLASAYEQLIPLVGRETSAKGEKTRVNSEPRERKTGGISG